MKDKVFIAWSGSPTIALKVRDKLQSQSSFICIIGGNIDNNSRFISIGDTVINQMKECNQAIIIFQKKPNGEISDNIFFELGCMYMKCGPTKIHCVSLSTDDFHPPSDFENAFINKIENMGKSDDNIANEIVNYFLSRQKMIVTSNKIQLINNRHVIRQYIENHYSEKGSSCSDYELSQYILFYMLAAHLFYDDLEVKQAMLEFKHSKCESFSTEVSIAVDVCIALLSVNEYIKSDPNSNSLYIEADKFWQIYKEIIGIKKRIIDEPEGVFYNWVKILTEDKLSFLFILLAGNPENDKKTCLDYCEKSKEAVNNCLQYIQDLNEKYPFTTNHDDCGIIAVIYSWLYRVMFLYSQFNNNTEEMAKWIGLALEQREILKNTYIKGSVDSHLYNTFQMEYYLGLIENIQFGNNIDQFHHQMICYEIDAYLEEVKRTDVRNLFIDKIIKYREEM